MTNNGLALKKRHSFLDFLYWSAMAAVPLLIGGMSIYRASGGWLAVYIITGIVLLGLVYRFYCTHCPHYTRDGKTTQCMFWWGMPKVFARRPGPLSSRDKTIALAASAILLLFPVNWLTAQPGMLIVYVLSVGLLVASMVRNECRRCLYFDCPANRVPDELKGKQVAPPPAK